MLVLTSITPRATPLKHTVIVSVSEKSFFVLNVMRNVSHTLLIRKFMWLHFLYDILFLVETSSLPFKVRGRKVALIPRTCKAECGELHLPHGLSSVSFADFSHAPTAAFIK